MRKKKILMSIGAMLASSILCITLVYAAAPQYPPVEAVEILLLYLAALGMILIFPLAFGLGIFDFSILLLVGALFCFSLFAWWIYLVIKSEREWIVVVPVIIWIVTGSIATSIILYMAACGI